MRVELLGTSGYHPTDTRHTACVLLPEVGVVLDAGTAFFRVGERLTTEELDIFISHAHLDHVIGLTYLPDLLRQRSLRRVTVHGDADKLRAIEEHLFATSLFPAPPAFQSRPIEQDLALPEAGRVRHFPVQHPGGALAFRLDWPAHSMAYVTDTTASPRAQYARQIEGVDLLLHECHFLGEMCERARQTGHSSLLEVARLAARCRVGRLILVHLNPSSVAMAREPLEAAQAIFPRIEVGSDRMQVEF